MYLFSGWAQKLAEAARECCSGSLQKDLNPPANLYLMADTGHAFMEIISCTHTETVSSHRNPTHRLIVEHTYRVQ